MLIKELFDNMRSASTVGTTGTNKPKTAKELHDERMQKRKNDIDKRKNAMKARAHPHAKKQENGNSDGDEVADDD